ncbi:MAG TPA: M28 family peptidase [Candidatus Eisenbacteria bacterium]|nr:M28 family peptidase [Candidatus Eisenbacteria bacterium]
MRPRFPALLPIAVLLAIAVAYPATAAPKAPTPDPRATRDFLAAVSILAADSMEGRGLETRGIRLAADYIEKRLKAAHLKPAFGPSHRQPFPVKVGVTLGPENRLSSSSGGDASPKAHDASDWTPLGFSGSGSLDGELVFAGYGIEAPAIGYEELSGLDLRGKIALLLRYEPQEKDEGSPFDGRRPSRWSALRYKTLQARERGAKAVVFVTGPAQDEGQDKIPVLQNDGPESSAGIPVLQVKTSVAQAWLRSASIDLGEWQKAVDRDLVPRRLGPVGVRLAGNVDVQARYVDAENVAGILPGKGALAKEAVVIGAHYDHLGYGGRGSMKPNEKAIHNGADDNASGTAAVLLAAERVQRALRGSKSHRTVVFALFSAEEVGLAGSSYLVDHPPVPIEKVAAMINLDMVGRVRGDTLTALGADSAEEWRALLETAGSKAGLHVTGRGDGYGPSDQTAFYAKGIPVVHLFSGAHPEYHTPADDASTVDPAGGARVVALTASLGEALARGEERPTYVRSSGAPAMTGDSRGYGAYLGTVPDFRSMEGAEGGVLLSDVRPGGPADLAGIRGGDRIVRMAGTRIQNLQDMTYALQDNKPGQTIEVVVVRNGAELSLMATLGDRSRMAAPAAAPAAAHGGERPVPNPSSADTTRANPARPSSIPAHGTAARQDSAGFTLPEFYRDRPGAGFAIGAGKPFTKTFEGERHFRDIRQLTFGGENAEPYFAPDGKSIVFQATVPGAKCDQQYVLDLATGATRLVSTGKGRTTCGYFDYPEADRIVYASTHEVADSCPPAPDMSQGYVWALYPSFDIFEAKPDGSDPKNLTRSPGYDAEATWCHRGGSMVFTSTRDGDIDLYAMDEAGSVKRLTNLPGYDGGAFYSPDCSEIVWRASRPAGDELRDYQRLLSHGLIRPSKLEIYVMKADGGDIQQITRNGAANFCPTFLADGDRILYSSNAGSASGREFDLWMVSKKGGADPERITFSDGFDGFPHFSPDGRWIVWSSNRADPKSRETNLFLARWVD